MPYRDGDPTVEIEGQIEHATGKAYLVNLTMGSKDQTWVPKSQVVSMSEPDGNGNVVFTVTQWWFDRAELEI